MSTVNIQTRIDNSQLQTQLDATNARTVQAANQVVATVNRASELSLLVLTVIGFTVDQTFRIQAYVVRTVINTFIQTRAALATANPLLAIETVITGGVMLFFLQQQLVAIETGRQETNARMSAAYSALRSAGGVYL